MFRKFLKSNNIIANLPVYALGVMLGLFTLAGPAAAERDDAAEAFVDSLASEAIKILGREGTPVDREADFRVLFTDAMDINRIAAFALGQYARTPTSEEKGEYLTLVEEFIIKIYASRLSDYTDQEFNVLSSQPKGRKGVEVIVKSQIEFATGREPVPVEWWLLKSDDGFKVFDVKVLGIWMVQEQRSAFISVIRNNNGNFSALLNHIQIRIGEATDEIDSKLTENQDAESENTENENTASADDS